MFETREFRVLLEKTLFVESMTRGVQKYDATIIDYLQNLAIENERDPSFLRRYTALGAVRVATRSLKRLLAQAFAYAGERGDPAPRLEDVEKAYQALFCKIWPFCK